MYMSMQYIRYSHCFIRSCEFEVLELVCALHFVMYTHTHHVRLDLTFHSKYPVINCFVPAVFNLSFSTFTLFEVGIFAITNVLSKSWLNQ